MTHMEETETRPEQNLCYRHFDLPEDFPVIGMLGSGWMETREPRKNMYFHNCMEIGYLLEGSGVIHLGDKEVAYSAPCVVLIPPHIPHTNQVDAGQVCRWKWMYVDPLRMLPTLSPRLSSMLAEYLCILGGNACVLREDEHPRICAMVAVILEELENKQQHYHHVVRSLFNALFLMLMRSINAREQKERYVNEQLGCIFPAVTYIAENYMKDVNLDSLSQLCHVSSSHFRRLFKQVLGWSPMDYVQKVRIDRACVLLYGGDLSMAEISQQVGYPSLSSFNRQFRRLHDMSPNQWRLQTRGEDHPTATALLDALPAGKLSFFPLENLNVR